ncbi:NAD(P)/FAD-dependent oxidoreductase [Methylomarinum sp. Ch1-1]|uniref:NAD(P)/FAD-dependent oxidoreductase n=1 Tax=Methylomarinum roseum TaxID=3067653 RepID=A0AAU7NSP1_9GAMM
MNNPEVVIIGAGAAGLMCAIEAGKRGRRVLVLDHANKAGKKILMSGGGRCNFTNYSVEPENYLSQNPHFCKSALSRYTQWDFLAFINRYQIPYHEREHGQLFCDRSAKDIVNMLLSECDHHGVEVRLRCKILKVQRKEQSGFSLTTDGGSIDAEKLVVATGGLSIPKMGATPFGYRLAEQFGISVIATRAGLVPFTWREEDKVKFAGLSGIAVPAVVSHAGKHFRENVLFTHRGLSGPAILQISSYWRSGETIEINLLPDLDLIEDLKKRRDRHANVKVKTLLTHVLPKRLVQALVNETLLELTLQNCADRHLKEIGAQLNHWVLKPNGTEGYRTAEVTVGGVDCNAVSSKTMESRRVQGLYFVGEVLDVTGWLGGYNFQWAWASGWCAGQFV